MEIKLLYFAQLREKFGRSGETIQTPASIVTVSDLIEHLAARGGAWQHELTTGISLKVAMDQELVGLDTVLRDSAEVAIFRPVTGG